MGLFSNKKKLCPLCGSPTPRLLPTKVEGMPICKECDRKVDLPNGVIDRMSVADLEQYMAFYDENQALRDKFTQTYKFDFGFGGGSLLLDETHGLFRLKDDPTALVMEVKYLKSFRVLEDSRPLYESTVNALRVHESSTPDRVEAMRTQITRFEEQKRDFERMERMADMLDRHDHDHDGRSGSAPRPLPPRPAFDAPAPVRAFHVELALTHPYWGSYSWKLDAPEFDRNYPSVEAYMQEYENMTSELHALAENLMRLINPNAETQTDSAPAQDAAPAPIAPAAPVSGGADDVIAQIQKYKGLLDAGLITEEEFTAKKRQLMGI